MMTGEVSLPVLDIRHDLESPSGCLGWSKTWARCVTGSALSRPALPASSMSCTPTPGRRCGMRWTGSNSRSPRRHPSSHPTAPSGAFFMPKEAPCLHLTSFNGDPTSDGLRTVRPLTRTRARVWSSTMTLETRTSLPSRTRRVSRTGSAPAASIRAPPGAGRTSATPSWRARTGT